MKRWWSWIALATTASALWGCGYSCPNGSPVGLYGCVVTCADLPADAGFVCVRPGDEQTFDDASGDRAITDGFGDAGDALSSDANDVVDMDHADVGEVEAGEAGTNGDGAVAADASDATGASDGRDVGTDGSTVIVDPMLATPRAVSPMSTSTVTSQRPTLRWSNGATVDGAVVEVSSTRDFATVLHRLSTTGDRARVPGALSAGVWFWRLRGRDSARNAEGTATSPVWWFRVGARSADGDRDRSWGTELDVNGDGYADLAVGSPNADSGRGRVDVFYGGPGGIGPTPSVTLRGFAAGDRFGVSVASAGDLNGDGFADIIVGADTADPGGKIDAGAASIFLGSGAGIATTPWQILEGALAGDWFGYSVTGIGDANGDGYGDVAIGASTADPGGRIDAGSASVFLGGAVGVNRAPSRVLEGAGVGDRFGSSVAGAGDLNGDGFEDLVVGAFFADPGSRSNAGTASIFHGGVSGMTATPTRVLEGMATNDYFGFAVAGVGDVNGDGFADVGVGAQFADAGGRTDCGSATVFPGSATGVPATPMGGIAGAAATDRLGFSIAGAGDVNGDGFADILVGAFGADPGGRMNAGTASLFHGGAGGTTAAAARVLEGVAPSDSFGSFVVGAGDLNGDGFSDVAVGAPSADPSSRMNAGTASIFHGAAAGIGATAARVLEGAMMGDSFGSSLASRFDAHRAPPFHAPRQRWPLFLTRIIRHDHACAPRSRRAR